jgi:predicted acetyltransferase
MMPEGFESHIYYEIDPEYQKKGYASGALRLLLDEARRIGLSEVILNVSDENIPSQRVAEKNGGELIEKKPAQNGEIFRKYIIFLRQP